jgi:diguanylate cyclase (GGDEF)-like protein/PAS domain S-box-containing protein
MLDSVLIAALAASVAAGLGIGLAQWLAERRRRRDLAAWQECERGLVTGREVAEQRAQDIERYIGDVEEARTRVERQAADYVGLMEELAEARDATERARADLQHKEEQLRRMTDALPVLVADIDADGFYRYCNDRYLDFFDLRAEAVIGRSIAEVFDGKTYVLLQKDIGQVISGREIHFRRAVPSHGEVRQIEGRYIPQSNADGVVDGFYVAAWDVTEQYHRELALDREVKTDALTGLLNRRALREALEAFAEALAGGGTDSREAGSTPSSEPSATGGSADQQPPDGAVMFLDIDHFKQINDTLGHAAGDQLLKIFAQRLRASVRGSDRVGRLGGDEFVVLLSEIGSSGQAERVAQKILERMQDPVGLEGRIIEIGTSIGIAYSRGEKVSADLLLQEADAALYEAKKAGRGTYRLHQIRDLIASI